MVGQRVRRAGLAIALALLMVGCGKAESSAGISPATGINLVRKRPVCVPPKNRPLQRVETTQAEVVLIQGSVRLARRLPQGVPPALRRSLEAKTREAFSDMLACSQKLRLSALRYDSAWQSAKVPLGLEIWFVNGNGDHRSDVVIWDTSSERVTSISDFISENESESFAEEICRTAQERGAAQRRGGTCPSLAETSFIPAFGGCPEKGYKLNGFAVSFPADDGWVSLPVPLSDVAPYLSEVWRPRSGLVLGCAYR